MTQARLGSAAVDTAIREALLAQREFGVAVCDASGLLLEINPTLEAMLGASYRRIPLGSGPSCYRLYDGTGRDRLAAAQTPLARALRGERVLDEVISVRRTDGSLRHMRCNGAPLNDSDGSLSGAVIFVADVTAQVVAAQELDELRHRLVATVNHELRTPVAVVKGHVELLLDLSHEWSSDAQWSLDAIGRGLARLEHVLDTIRQISDEATDGAEQVDHPGVRPASASSDRE